MIVLRQSCDKEESATNVRYGSDENGSSIDGKASQSDILVPIPSCLYMLRYK